MFRQFAKVFGTRFQKLLFARRARTQYERVLNAFRRDRRPVTNVLFLCYGNICRSPFAARAAGVRWKSDIVICSAGFHQTVGRQSPQHVVEVARDLGVDLAGAKSVIVTEDKILTADLILVMDKANLDCLRERFPHAVSRAIMLGMCDTEGASAEIADPYDLSVARTREIFKKIIKAIECLGRDLKLDRERSNEVVA